MRELSRVAGFVAPIRIAAQFDTMTEEEAQAILDEMYPPCKCGGFAQH